MNPWIDPAELGLAAYGDDVKISRHAVILNPGNIRLGSHIRIDAFAVVSAGPLGIELGDYIHLAVGVCLFGTGGRIVLEDHAQVSCRAILYTADDDYVNGSLIGPTVPDRFRGIKTGDIWLERFAAIGAGSILLPGLHLAEGSAVGSLSLVKRPIPAGQVWAGVPAKHVADRDLSRLRQLAAELHSAQCFGGT